MLVPIYLGLCRAADVDSSHEAAGALINGNLSTAVLVSLVHGAAMIAAGGLFAWLVYRYLGLNSWRGVGSISISLWALSLVLIGALSFGFSLSDQH